MVGMPMRANNNPISGMGIGVPKLGKMEFCFKLSLSGQRMHRSCVEGGLVLAVIGRCGLVDRLGWAEEELRRVKFNYYGNFEG